MDTLAQSFLDLLVAPPGNLIYHLVLVFAVTGTAQAIIVGRSPLRAAQVRRAVIGLGMLLLAQVILFLASGLVWQGLIQAGSTLPILDRSMSAFSILWIVWLWAFPKPKRWADALAALGSVLIFIMLVFSLVAWNSQSGTPPFNASWIDWGWGLFSIVLSLVGILLLIIRQTSGWGIGIAILALNLVGQLAHLGWGMPQGDYSAIIRLTQLCAYPLLPTLTGRLHTALPQSSPKTPAAAPVAPSPDTLGTLETWLHMVAGADLQRRLALSRVVAQILPADICLVASVPKNDGDPIYIECGFDSVDNVQIAQTKLDSVGFPALAKALASGQMIWIKEDAGKGLDIRILGDLIGLRKTSDTLLIPLQRNGLPWAALLLLSPISNHKWSPEDQQRLSRLSDFMVQILQPSPKGRPGKVPIDKPEPAFHEGGRQSAEFQLDSADAETIIAEPPGREKDEIIERLQKENMEMNDKFAQLQQDIILLGEQSDLASSNLGVLPEYSDPGQWEKPGQFEPVIEPQGPSDSDSLNQTIKHIQQKSQALTAQTQIPLTEADELASEAANLILRSPQKGRENTPTAEEMLSEINFQTEQLIQTPAKVKAPDKISEGDLIDLESLITLDNSDLTGSSERPG